MTTGLLSKADLRQLTGRVPVAAQEAWLRAEGIPCRRNGKSELVVAWTHVHAWLEGKERPRSQGINWAAA
jgi:hypothetical protein